MTDDHEPSPDQLKELADMLRAEIEERLGPDVELKVFSSFDTPAALEQGSEGHTEWEIRLMADNSPANQILVQLHPVLHPRVFEQANRLLDDHLVVLLHECHDGPEHWHATLHVIVEESEVCVEIARQLAQIIDANRISRIRRHWLRLRRRIAGWILPEGYSIE